MLQLTQ